PERARVPECSPERACVPKFCQERASIPNGSPGRAFVPEGSPGSLEAHKCPPTCPFLPPPPLPSDSPSACPQPTICAVGSLR
ncbi:hypothetical protein M9458_042091, partial [Cirrhinus mrigala]